MKFKAEIKIMPLRELLDPQGKAVERGLKNLELNTISNVRIGKHVVLEIEADTKEEAELKVADACDKLLANKVMESYDFTVEKLVQENA